MAWLFVWLVLNVLVVVVRLVVTSKSYSKQKLSAMVPVV
jgi:hypothetical protein